MIDFGSSDSDFVEEPRSRRSRGDRISTLLSNPTATTTIEVEELPPEYIVELARSGRAECKRCASMIVNKELRVGVIVEGDWGIMTRWQHLRCTVFHKSIKDPSSLDGYSELDPGDQRLVLERVLQSLGETDEDDVPVDPNELIRTAWTLPMEPPPELVLPLLPYQKEGLGWMVNQELNGVHGGILADEMGMGKTMQAISLILSNKPDPLSVAQLKDWKESDLKHDFSGLPSSSRGKTLIVVPTIALRQWRNEIHRFSKEGSLNVLIYHGENRETDTKRLREADVVLTTYKIIEIEYRKATAGTKITCSICKKKFYPEKLRIHRKYFCGDDAERTEAQARTVSRGWRRLSASAEVPHKKNGNSSSEDEISREKKKNKAGSAAATAPSRAGKEKGKVISKIVESLEDEIAEQKRAIKIAASRNTESKSKDIPFVGTAAPLDRSKIKSEKKIIAASSSSDGESIPQIKKRRAVSISKNSERKVSASRSTTPASKGKGKGGTEPSASNQMMNTSSSRRSPRVATSATKKPLPRYVDDSDESNAIGGFSEDSVSKASSGSSSEDSDSQSSCSSSAGRMRQQKKSRAASSAPCRGGTATLKKINTAKKNEKKTSKIDSSNSAVEDEIRRALLKHENDNKNGSSKVSVLHQISWFRIILDEAHLIKDRSTSTAHASFALVSLNKWCLTGTPLQNRVGELYSLVRFLRLDPHAFYYCRTKGCSCKSLHYRFTQGRCDDCNHTAMQHFCHFNKHILNPIKRAGYVSEGKRAMMKLKDQILDSILLRRTKVDRADDIMLPARFVSVRQEYMDERETDFYDALYTQSKAQFNTYVQSGTVLNNYAHIFDILIRLRQAVDHPYLVIYSDTIKDYNGASSRLAISSEYSAFESNIAPSCERGRGSDKALSCALCREPPDDPRKAKCGHVFCKMCAIELVDSAVQPPSDAGTPVGAKRRHGSAVAGGCLCPQCDKPLTISSIGDEDITESTAAVEFKSRKASIISKINLDKFQSSSKLEALVQELNIMSESDPGAKAIVFSQFVNMLDLIAFRLHLESIGCNKLLGYMTVEHRDEAIKNFNEDPETKVLLISLKTGGVALNLTVANYIFLMDPWWNPAAEMQAIDRAHRIGQNKPIFATRFIIKDSIEERILHLQEKKQLVFEGTVGGDAGSMARLTVDDMRFLFQ